MTNTEQSNLPLTLTRYLVCEKKHAKKGYVKTLQKIESWTMLDEVYDMAREICRDLIKEGYMPSLCISSTGVVTIHLALLSEDTIQEGMNKVLDCVDARIDFSDFELVPKRSGLDGPFYNLNYKNDDQGFRVSVLVADSAKCVTKKVEKTYTDTEYICVD